MTIYGNYGMVVADAFAKKLAEYRASQQREEEARRRRQEEENRRIAYRDSILAAVDVELAEASRQISATFGAPVKIWLDRECKDEEWGPNVIVVEHDGNSRTVGQLRLAKEEYGSEVVVMRVSVNSFRYASVTHETIKDVTDTPKAIASVLAECSDLYSMLYRSNHLEPKGPEPFSPSSEDVTTRAQEIVSKFEHADSIWDE